MNDNRAKLSKPSLVEIGQRLKREAFPARREASVPEQFVELLRELDQPESEARDSSH